MKRILILLISLLAAFPLCAQQTFSPDLMSLSVAEFRRMKAEQLWQEFPKFEVRVGYSGFPIADMISYGWDSDWEIIPPNLRNELEDMYSPAEGASYMTGNFNAEFSWHIKRWFTLAGGLYFNGMYGSTIDPATAEVISRDRGVTFSFIPTARFYWLNSEKCRLYSSVGLGFMAGGFRDDRYAIPAFQFSPFGVTAGRKVFFFAEYSMGTTYFGGQIGLGYRF